MPDIFDPHADLVGRRDEHDVHPLGIFSLQNAMAASGPPRKSVLQLAHLEPSRSSLNLGRGHLLARGTPRHWFSSRLPARVITGVRPRGGQRSGETTLPLVCQPDPETRDQSDRGPWADSNLGIVSGVVPYRWLRALLVSRCVGGPGTIPQSRRLRTGSYNITLVLPPIARWQTDCTGNLASAVDVWPAPHHDAER